MAEAGFYWCGTEAEPDSAACFLCGKVLDNWECDDDPWLEHRKHAPQCMFANYSRPEAQLTLSEFLDVLKKMAADTLERKKLLDEQRIRKDGQHLRQNITKYFAQ